MYRVLAGQVLSKIGGTASTRTRGAHHVTQELSRWHRACICAPCVLLAHILCQGRRRAARALRRPSQRLGVHGVSALRDLQVPTMGLAAHVLQPVKKVPMVLVRAQLVLLTRGRPPPLLLSRPASLCPSQTARSLTAVLAKRKHSKHAHAPFHLIGHVKVVFHDAVSDTGRRHLARKLLTGSVPCVRGVSAESMSSVRVLPTLTACVARVPRALTHSISWHRVRGTKTQ